MGRPRKPTALKILEGNRGKRAMNSHEPKPDTTAPTCPPWLDAPGRKCWRRLVKILHPIGLLTTADGDELAMYCVTWSRWRSAEDMISKHGSFYPLKDKIGNVRCMMPMPAVSEARAALDTLTKLAREFGMTPAARSRMMVLPQTSKDENPWAGSLANVG